jgi:hypothetical protein
MVAFEMSGKSAEVMLERLVAIEWTNMEGANKHEASRARLMREYLRRAAVWADELGGPNNWPFFDVAGRIAPSVEASSELAAKLEEYLEENVGGISTEDVCRAALRWATLRDVAEEQIPDLPDPFEPLLLMYERGGEVIADETRSFHFGSRMVRVKPWREHIASESIVSLDPAELDALDAEGK